MRSLARVLLLLLSFSAAAHAQQSTPQRRVLVESVEIQGNRRLTDEELLARIRVRPGDPYDERRVHRDFQALLDLGVFDTTATRFMIEDGARGGKVVVFQVLELPLIAELKLKGLPRGLAEADVLKAVRAKGVQEGGVCDPAALRRALESVKALLAARGLSDLSVGWRVGELSLWRVSVVFEFTGGRAASGEPPSGPVRGFRKARWKIREGGS
ncbi:MAG TPA: POTRA domain-containing protein [Pyrinomonadaceae bacterium]|jgi:outer membrane protein assembly factor BamA